MYIEKSCRNCRDNDNCCLLDKIDFDLETEVQCKLEEGIFEEAIKEELNLTDVFQQMQDDGIIKKNIKIKDIDDESIKFITFASSAQEITNIIMNNLSDFPCAGSYCLEKWITKPLDKKMKHLVISEMTAGVGGNVLNFANYFKYVNAIELDSTRYNYLNKNIKLYGYNNINCYNADSITLLVEKDDIAQDIIFFDPPWGGKNYKLHSTLRILFGNFSIENVCKVLFQRPHNKMIVMKLPNNYDFDYMVKELKEYRLSKYSLNRMTIIVIKNYPLDS